MIFEYVRKTIVVDSNGLYFTDIGWNNYWSKDPDNAHHFEEKEQAVRRFEEPVDQLYLIKGTTPFEFKIIYTQEKHDNKKE